jgi:hypothetical protein
MSIVVELLYGLILIIEIEYAILVWFLIYVGWNNCSVSWFCMRLVRLLIDSVILIPC